MGAKNLDTMTESAHAVIERKLLAVLADLKVPFNPGGFAIIDAAVFDALRAARIQVDFPLASTWARDEYAGLLQIPTIEKEIRMNTTPVPTYTGPLLCGLNPFENVYATKNGQRWRCTRVEHTPEGAKFHGVYESRRGLVCLDAATLRPWKDALPFDLEPGKVYVLSDGRQAMCHGPLRNDTFLLADLNFHPRGNAVFGHNNLTVLGEYFPRGLELGAEYETIVEGMLQRGVCKPAADLDRLEVGCFWFYPDGTNRGTGSDRRVLRKLKDAPPAPVATPEPFFEEGEKYTITLCTGQQEICTATRLTPSISFPKHPWCLSNSGHVRKFFNDRGEHCMGDFTDVKKYVGPAPNPESALQSKCRKQAQEIQRLQKALEEARTPRPADPRVGRLQKELEAAQQATSRAVSQGIEDVRTLKRHTDRLEAKLASAEILCRAFELHPEHSPEVRAHRVRCKQLDAGYRS
jgi:hypothetical protein